MKIFSSIFVKVVLVTQLALLSACVNRDPTRVSFPAHSEMSIILMRAGPAHIEYTVSIAPFDETAQTIDSRPFHGPTHFIINNIRSDSYVAVKIVPGTYVFLAVMQQAHWGVCFKDATLAFTVHANEAVFLGDFQPTNHLNQIESLATEHGDQIGHLGYPVVPYSDPGIYPLQITTPGLDTADFRAAKQYEGEFLPALQGRLRPVQYRAAKFGSQCLDFPPT